MSAPSIVESDLRVVGNFSAQSITYPPSSIEDADIDSGTAIDNVKLCHRHYAIHRQALGAAVVAKTELVHRCYAAGTLLDIAVVVDSVPAGGSQTVTVNVQLSHAGGAPATVLTAPVVVNSASAARSEIAAAIAASPVADGDLLYVFVTVGGAGGTQAAGLLVSILVSENPVP